MENFVFTSKKDTLIKCMDKLNQITRNNTENLLQDPVVQN